ncbi:uncharacterized protein N7483_008274 [Penicillium malachiteum]|uniref:uncharacterized protein n=1 Tax=Penicillium malachiteum TaxID=1324776 RepID=UPI0025488777|nr:uncharacterized protein N7483_008274 [Penicillium malachiteum]KAJ5720340.1 hypothetical protein N7483_008274 [Penicillium malachiteum]
MTYCQKAVSTSQPRCTEKAFIPWPGTPLERLSRAPSRGREVDNTEEPKLSDKQEKELLKICGEWIDFGHELKCEEFVAGLGDALLERDSEYERGGATFMDHIYPKWSNPFFSKFPVLKRKMTDARKAARVEQDDLAKQWLSNLKSLINRYGIQKENMHIMKELSFLTLKTRKTKAVTVIRPSEPNDERRFVASAINCFSADGTLPAPWAIVKGVADSSCQSSAQLKVICNENGFINRFHLKRWLTDHFDPQTRSSLKSFQWRLMLVDGYRYPVKEDFFFWCRERKILCITLPKNKREDLDPFYWGVGSRLDREYRKSLILRWKQHLERAEHEAYSKKSIGIILKPREFADILRKMTVEGTSREIGERKNEAANAWRSALFASLGAQIRDPEDPEPWNKENMDELFAAIDERDLGS